MQRCEKWEIDVSVIYLEAAVSHPELFSEFGNSLNKSRKGETKNER